MWLYGRFPGLVTGPGGAAGHDNGGNCIRNLGQRCIHIGLVHGLLVIGRRAVEVNVPGGRKDAIANGITLTASIKVFMIRSAFVAPQ